MSYHFEIRLFFLYSLELNGQIIIHFVDLVLMIYCFIVQLRKEIHIVGEHVLVQGILTSIVGAATFLSNIPRLFVCILHVVV
jgi:hypothetical protein